MPFGWTDPSRIGRVRAFGNIDAESSSSFVAVAVIVERLRVRVVRLLQVAGRQVEETAACRMTRARMRRC